MKLNVLDVTNDLQTSARRTSGDSESGHSSRSARRRRVLFWAIVLLLGLVQAWAHRLLVDHDGVAYIDIAANYARGAWGSAINAYYSPLYSWLLAPLLVLRFPRSWESTLLHLVNFVGYLGAYASFEFFLRQLIRKTQADSYSQENLTGLSETSWYTLGLGLFLYSTLFMANLSGHSGQGDPGSTPDIFVLLFVCLAGGLLLRIEAGPAGRWTYSALGIALAFGYFAKTAMFPLSFVFMAVAGLLSIRQRKNALTFLLTPICFLLLAGLWIGVLHHITGRYTFGDAGTLTYRWLAGPRANPVEWGGQTEEEEHLIHPPRRLSTNPPVFEFGTPIAGTFPLWYGNSYWLQGWKFHFSWAGQKRILHDSYNNYRGLLDNQKEYLVLLFLMIMVEGTVLGYLEVILRQWVLWIPALAALAMYALVRVEPRYVAAFWLMLWMSLFAAVRLSKKDAIQQFTRCAVAAVVLTTGVNLLHAGLADLHTVLRNSPSEQSEVAAGLHKLGVREGQSLATIGIPRDSYYWARLAGVRVVSEIPSPNVNQYWFASTDIQQKVRSLFAKAGAFAIVTDAIPSEVTLPDSTVPMSVPGWQRIGNTSYFFFPLETEAHPSQP